MGRQPSTSTTPDIFEGRSSRNVVKTLHYDGLREQEL